MAVKVSDDLDLTPYFTKVQEDSDWMPFFREASDSLLTYKNDRKGLYREIKNLGYYLMDDVDPFSVLGWIYRRRLTRHREAVYMAQFLGIKSKIPLGKFAVHLYEQSTYFFREKGKRDEKDIEKLWNAFEDALNYADRGSRSDEKKFKESFTAAYRLPEVKGKLTIVLFWCRPDKFIALDTNTDKCLKKWGMHVPSKLEMNGESYLALMEKLRNKLPRDGMNSISDFVWNARECEDLSADVKKIQKVLGSNVSSAYGGGGISAMVKDLSVDNVFALERLGYYVDSLPASGNREFIVQFIDHESGTSGRVRDGIKADREKIQKVLGATIKIIHGVALGPVVKGLPSKDLGTLGMSLG